MNIDDLARNLKAYEKTDGSAFRRRARMLQSLWREEQGFQCGEHRGRQLGSRLPMPWAQETLANYLSEGIRQVVRTEVCDADCRAGKMYGKPRIFNDLLSSQPLCFNLFGELQTDLAALSAVICDLTAGRFTEVHAIDFEYSPGRRDPRYTGDRSAFDVFLKCLTPTGYPGFIGIEVKYHENLKGRAGGHKDRYDEIADDMGCFTPDSRVALRRTQLQQIWRDHLLMGAMQEADGYSDALFVILYPEQNVAVAEAVKVYTDCLADSSSFAAWTLEDLVGRLKTRSRAVWLDLFENRYLAFDKIDKRLSTMPGDQAGGEFSS